MIVAHDLFELVIAESIMVGILGLAYPVGVKQQAVTGANRHFIQRVVGIREYTEQHAVAFDALKLACAPEHERRMSRRGIERDAILRVEPKISGGDQPGAKFHAENAVQFAQDLLWVVCARQDGLHGHLNHGRNERGGDSVPGDVGHQEAGAIRIDRNEIVEIAGDVGHRTIEGGDTQIFQFGIVGRKNRGLHLTGNREFAFDGNQTAFAGQGDLHRDISKREEENRQSQRAGNPPGLVVKNERQGVIQRLDGEDQRPGGDDGTIGKNQKLAGESWNRDDDEQDHEGGGCDDIVVENQLAGRAGRDKKPDSGDGDDQTDSDHDLNEQLHYSDA